MCLVSDKIKFCTCTIGDVEPPRLKALIEEVLKISPNLSASIIHSKIGDVAIADVRKCIFKMVKDEVLDFSGANKNRVYYLAKKR
ncbi:hypothetical protein [Flavobacterium ovatum]|uniref:hypothetical protein n=1 Tax=Flavobacterium ovatum TaxID=1928857 RepID=UPI00344CC41C